MRQAKTAHIAAVYRQEILRTIMNKAISALQDAGITPVVLKGFSLARLYPDSQPREWGDIDLYVGQENYHAGAKALREAFPDAALFDREEDYYKHYNLTFYKPFPTAIEMHRVSIAFAHPRDARFFARLEEEGLVKQRFHYHAGEDEWFEPEWKFNVLFTFCHSWEHWTHGSANLRQLQDLALLLTVGKPDEVSYQDLEGYLHRNLKRLHLLRAWQLYAYILVNRFAVPAASCPLYDERVASRSEALLASVTSCPPAVSCEPSLAAKNILLRKLYTFRRRVKEARRIARYEPVYARHMVWATIAQSWRRFLSGQNTRKWE